MLRTTADLLDLLLTPGVGTRRAVLSRSRGQYVVEARVSARWPWCSARVTGRTAAEALLAAIAAVVEDRVASTLLPCAMPRIPASLGRSTTVEAAFAAGVTLERDGDAVEAYSADSGPAERHCAGSASVAASRYCTTALA